MKTVKILILILIIGFSITLTFGIQAQESVPQITVTELKAKIDEITAAIERLQATLAQLTVKPGISTIPPNFIFQQNLKYGTSSQDIKYLQIVLNQDQVTQVSQTGAGAPGKETIYFAQRTLRAVMKFQEKHKQDILVPLGLSRATGYVGPATRKKLNQLLEQYRSEIISAPPTPTLSVVLIAFPDSGTVPLLGVDLQARVFGTAQGNINYTFYCHRQDTGTNITTPYSAKYDNLSETVKSALRLCSYNQEGEYTVKVIVERETLQAESRAIIVVSSPTLPPIIGGPPAPPPAPPLVPLPPVPTPPVPTPYCGDGQCNNTEICSTCPEDCGTCPVPPPPINNPPVLDPIGNKSVTVNNALTFIVSATDIDSTLLTFLVQNLPSGATFNDSSRIFSWTPIATGTYQITFVVSDGSLTDSEAITITVNPVTPVCGDGQCNSTETCSTCPQDCGTCPAGNVYYLDAVNGNTTTGDGSEANPWGTLQSVNEAGKFGTTIVSGDAVKLKTGFHGQFILPAAGIKNTDYISIEADGGAIADLSHIFIKNSNYWRFKGLRISPSFSPGLIEARKGLNRFHYRTIILLWANNNYITIEDCNIFTVEDASGWDANDWRDTAWDGLYGGTTHFIARNNLIRNISTGLASGSPYTLMEGNTINGIGCDGIYSAYPDNSIFQDNIIINYFDDNDSGTHSDGIQFNDVNNMIIRRNYINAGQGNHMGINILKALTNSTIENNVVMSTSGVWGIAIGTHRLIDPNMPITDNVKILNNTVIRPYNNPNNPQDWPNIYTYPEKSQNVLVRNNIADVFPQSNTTRNITVENNLKITNYTDDEIPSFFVNYTYGDVRPLISSPICNGSVNPVGVAVGALPCVCTNNSQCEEVFGSGYICDTGIEECVEAPVQNIYYVSPTGNGALNGSSPENAFNLTDAQNYANSHLSETITFLLASGNYGDFSHHNVNRTNWITYEAAPGHTPVFTSIWITAFPNVVDSYLKFIGITVTTNDYIRAHIKLQNCQYLEFDNVKIKGHGYEVGDLSTGFILWGAYHVSIKNSVITGIGTEFQGGVQFGIESLDSDHITISNCKIDQCFVGIEVDGNDWLIEDCEVFNIDNDAIQLNDASDVTINRNRIHDVRSVLIYSDDAGASYDAATGVITRNPSALPYPSAAIGNEAFARLTDENGNYITTVDSGGYRFEWLFVKNATPDNLTLLTSEYPVPNQDYNIAKVEVRRGEHNDFIQFKANGPCNNVTVSNNICYNSFRNGFIFFPQTGGGSSGLLIENNLIYNANQRTGGGRSCIQATEIQNIVLRNNTLNGGVTAGLNVNFTSITGNIIKNIALQRQSGNVVIDEMEYNIFGYWNTYHMGPLPGPESTNQVLGNANDYELYKALFSNYNTRKFTLVPGSLAIDFGNPAYAPATDILGNPRDALPDAGCYEFGLIMRRSGR